MGLIVMITPVLLTLPLLWTVTADEGLSCFACTSDSLYDVRKTKDGNQIMKTRDKLCGDPISVSGSSTSLTAKNCKACVKAKDVKGSVYRFCLGHEAKQIRMLDFAINKEEHDWTEMCQEQGDNILCLCLGELCNTGNRPKIISVYYTMAASILTGLVLIAGNR